MMWVDIVMAMIFFYLGISVIYAFIFSVAGRLGKIPSSPLDEAYRKFAVLMPSYKEDEVILKTAALALEQNYPKEFYDVVVIADSLQPDTVSRLKQMPLTVIEVKFDISTKAKSLNEAFRILPENYDYALVLDADNIMEKNFIRKLNGVLVKTGAKAIQGHRVAKNLNTNFAILDAISEEVNNHIYRKGHRVLGMASGLIGSGMAFDYLLFKNLMAGNRAIGGFDKETEHKLLRDRIKIEYAEDALVYDEKVQNPEVFGNQRRRWISAQIHYCRKYFLQGLWHLISRGNIDFFDKAFQQVMPPRILLLGALFVIAMTTLLTEMAFAIAIYPGFIFWINLFLINSISLMIAIPDQYYNRKTVIAALQLPRALTVMFLTLFKLKGANKRFIHTPHNQ